MRISHDDRGSDSDVALQPTRSAVAGSSLRWVVMPANRMSRNEFYAAMAPNDDARLRKVLWTVYWRERPAARAHRGRAAPTGTAEAEADEGTAGPGHRAGRGDDIRHAGGGRRLLLVAQGDHLVPSELAIAAFDTAHQPKELVILPGGHFDAYTDGFEASSGRARDWFTQYLAA
jgi:hypothetical protein